MQRGETAEQNFISVSQDGEIYVWDFSQRKQTSSLNREVLLVKLIQAQNSIIISTRYGSFIKRR